MRARRFRAEAVEAERVARRKEELDKRATASELQTALAPFLAACFERPELSGETVRLRRTADKRPMSLAWLQSVGALNPTIVGLKMLARIAGDRDLPAPRWAIPTEPGNWTVENQEFLRRAQKMLIGSGLVLVEEGMLSP